MAGEQIELRLGLSGDGLDDDALADYAAALADEIGELDVDEVTGATAGDAPPGSKGIELMAIGALVVKLARSRKLLGQFIAGLRDWLGRNDTTSVRVEIDGDVIELSAASADERRALVDAWVQRHSEP